MRPDQTWNIVQDTNLRHSLQFGIGLHHAGLNDSDRSTVEHLFVAGKIQVRPAVLVCTLSQPSP